MGGADTGGTGAGGTGMGANGGTGMGANGMGGSGANGGTGMGGSGANGGTGMGANGMGANGGSPACEISTLDTNQGNQPPAFDECAEIGANLEAAYDAAIVGKPLKIAPLVGTWIDGAGTAKIELMLAQNGAGMLRFGEASEFPLIADPTEPFLTEVTANDPRHVLDLGHEKIQPGFGYSVLADTGGGSQMSFHIQVFEAFETWCAQQPSLPGGRAPNCYSCMEDVGYYTFYTSDDNMGCGVDQGCFGTDPGTGELSRVDCGRLALCAVPFNAACVCTAERCFANRGLNDQLAVYPFTVTVDPVAPTFVRLESLSPFQTTTYYLEKQ
jgi:hypothetical protein